MKIWVYVEGRSDKGALSVLFRNWMQDLKMRGWGIEFVSLNNKSKYLNKIGPRVAEKLVNNSHDLVIGLPDLYPNQDYEKTEYSHNSLQELRNLQTLLVKRSLQKKVGPGNTDLRISRFYASALKHDLEMLFLTVPRHLQTSLRMKNAPKGWRLPPEDQNQNNPPKNIVEKLFRIHRKQSYLEAKDGHAILRNVDISEVLYDERGQEQCPTFRAMLDWIGEKTGVKAYSIDSAE